MHYGAASGACYDTAPLSLGIESWAWSRGVSSFVSWSPGYTIAQVNSGAYDSCFQDVAQRFKAFGHPVWLRLWWEFNGTWFPWSYDPSNPQAFISAWQRVVNIFKSVGATNTMFVWAPDEGYFDSSKTLTQNGYPGDAYVDWVASDAYNWNTSTAWCTYHAGWCDFSEIFHHGGTGSSAHGVEVAFRGRKPFAVAETGSVEDPANGAHKGQWMQNMDASIKSDFPDLKMLLYSDFMNQNDDWRIDTSASSLSGFKALALDPYFHTR
jgi:beta-mannanase